MSASTVETPSVDRKSHDPVETWIASLAGKGVWTGITRQISMTSKKLGKPSCTWKIQSFHALDSHRTAVKTLEIIISTLTRYVANIGMEVIILWASFNENRTFASVRNSNKTLQLAAENHFFFQNADSRFLVNIIICSILTLFPSCKHRHQYYMGIIQIFEQLRFFNFVKWNMIPRVPHDFNSGKQFICRLSLFTNKKVNHSIAILMSNLNFLFGRINYIHDVYYSRSFKFRML